jgi:hypothetical protein
MIVPQLEMVLKTLQLLSVWYKEFKTYLVRNSSSIEFVIHETPIRWGHDLDTSIPLPSVTCSLMLSDTLVALGRSRCHLNLVRVDVLSGVDFDE